MVRIPIEARCRLTDKSSGAQTDYILGGNCKTERVAADRDIWVMPNADFNLIYSENALLIIKHWERVHPEVPHEIRQGASQLERQAGKPEDAWAWHRLDLVLREGRELEVGRIVDAVLDNRRLVAQTEFDTASGLRVLLEYPVKTVNVNEVVPYYQVDTGPVPFPYVQEGLDDPIEGFHLAFVAHWLSDRAEFIVNVPTPVGEGLDVNHYSQPVRMEGAENRLFEVVRT